MKNKNKFFLLLIFSFNFLLAVKLPDAKTLSSRLSKYGFEYLIENTKIINDLSDQEIDLTEIIISIERLLDNFAQNHKDLSDIAIFMQKRKNYFYMALFENDPLMLKEILKKEEELNNKSTDTESDIIDGNPDPDHRLTLRIPKWLMNKVDIKRKERVGKISRNLWILETIDKATKDIK